MKAVHFGAGNIGRGFIGELLNKSGYEIVFVDVDKGLIEKINADNSYKMYILSYAGKEMLTINNVKALSPLTDEPAIIEEIATADLITTSVCADNFAKIAKTLARGLNARAEAIDIMACENAYYASSILKEVLLQNALDIISKEKLEQIGNFVDVAVDRIALAVEEDGIKIPLVQEDFELVVDKNKLSEAKIGLIKDAIYTGTLDKYLERKLFVFNCGHAATAYLGNLKGYKTIHAALEDKELHDDIVKLMLEASNSLRTKYDFSEEELQLYVKKIIKRIAMKELGDEVIRVGRSPIRKLAINDRLLGPTLLAEENKLPNNYLIKGIAAGYLFDIKEDNQAEEIQKYIAEYGILKTILKYSLDEKNNSLAERIAEEYEKLKKEYVK